MSYLLHWGFSAVALAAAFKIDAREVRHFAFMFFLMIVFHRPFSSSRLAHGNLCLRCTKGGKKIWLELGCALGPQVAEERLT